MSKIGALDPSKFFNNAPYIEALKLNVEQTQQEQLANVQQNAMAGATQSSSKLPFILADIGVLAVVVLFVLKKKKMI